MTQAHCFPIIRLAIAEKKIPFIFFSSSSFFDPKLIVLCFTIFFYKTILPQTQRKTDVSKHFTVRNKFRHFYPVLDRFDV